MGAINIEIDGVQVAPDEPNMGFRCGQFVAVHVQISQLVNVTDYVLQHYGLTDDEVVNDSGQVIGPSTFPAATEWPEMDTLARSKTAAFHQDVNLDGVERYEPRITAITTGGSPELVMTLRFRSAEP